jgi:hypothetical protein
MIFPLFSYCRTCRNIKNCTIIEPRFIDGSRCPDFKAGA